MRVRGLARSNGASSKSVFVGEICFESKKNMQKKHVAFSSSWLSGDTKRSPSHHVLLDFNSAPDHDSVTLSHYLGHMVMTSYQYILQVANNREDRAALPVWCMFNTSPAQRDGVYTELNPFGAILGGCVCCSLTHTLADKEGCLEDFFFNPPPPPHPPCLSKNKEMADRAQKPILPIFSG